MQTQNLKETSRELALIVEDDENAASAYSKMLSQMGFTVLVARTLKDAIANFKPLSPAVVLLDVGLPDGNGLSLLQQFSLDHSKAPKFVVITGDNSQSVAIECLRAQVDDFLPKPVSLSTLRGCFGKLFSQKEPANESQHGHKAYQGSLLEYRRQASCVFVGSSAAVKELTTAVKECASSNVCAVVTGAAGSYKQGVAYSIHAHSGKSGKLIKLDSGDFESPLSRVTTTLTAKVNAAKNGTLFINDLSALPKSAQHFLIDWCDANRAFNFSADTPALVGILHGEPDIEIESGRLSAELYYRLAQRNIRVPGLSGRTSDIPDIANKIIDSLNRSHNTVKTASATEIEQLEVYEWKGSIRELNSVIELSYSKRGSALQFSEHLVSSRTSKEQSSVTIASLVGNTFWEIEKSLLFATLESVNGNKSEAAELLGISLKTLYNRLNAYS